LIPDPPRSDQGNHAFSKWPLRTFLELGALPTAVPCARLLHTRQVAWEWGFQTEASSDIELLVSELVSNSVAASAEVAESPVVRLWLLSDRTQVLILVWDASPLRPARIDVDEEAESGRGLLLVETISSQWGCYFPLDGDQAKVTWALLQAQA
jgi:anti-sigma regulatory factor (Ser/Thr protein kinase)